MAGILEKCPGSREAAVWLERFVVAGWQDGFWKAVATSLEGLAGAGVAYELEASGRSRRCLRQDRAPFPVEEPPS
jgi:hypothetical protein